MTLSGRERGKQLRDAIFKAYADVQEARQPNSLRPGEIGHECEFYLWLRFRWSVPVKNFEGRMLRLFGRGHREEPVIFNDLRTVGAEVWDRDPDNPAKQIAMSTFHGHSKGYLDGVAKGVPYALCEYVLTEAKTHSDKSFKELDRDGVQVSKPQHYAQMQLYMDEHKLSEALYFAVNKNNDDLHLEFVDFDPVYVQRLRLKGEKVAFRQDAPSKLSRKPEFFKCKFCDAKDVCHADVKPVRSCRNCIEAVPLPERDARGDGVWRCRLHDKNLSRDEQKVGCADHRYLVGILNGEVTGTTDDTVTYKLLDGEWTDRGPLEDRPVAPGSEPVNSDMTEPALP